METEKDALPVTLHMCSQGQQPLVSLVVKVGTQFEEQTATKELREAGMERWTPKHWTDQ